MSKAKNPKFLGKKLDKKTNKYKKKEKKSIPNSPVENYKKYKNSKPIDTRQSKIDTKDKYKNPYTGKMPYEDKMQKVKNKIAEKRRSTRFGDDRTWPAHSGVNPNKQSSSFLDKIKNRIKK